MKNKLKDHLKYQVLCQPSDMRFPKELIEGGIDKKLAIHIARKQKKMGLIVRIFDPIRKQFVKF